ncbi:hypothetical protein [Mycolicibacterium sp. XJ870]
MDPRRIELSRRHCDEMGQLFAQFLEDSISDESGIIAPMTDAEEAAWNAFSSGLYARHRAERAALAEALLQTSPTPTGGGRAGAGDVADATAFADHQSDKEK